MDLVHDAQARYISSLLKGLEVAHDLVLCPQLDQAVSSVLYPIQKVQVRRGARRPCERRVLHQGANLGVVQCSYPLGVQEISNASDASQFICSISGNFLDMICEGETIVKLYTEDIYRSLEWQLPSF